MLYSFVVAVARNGVIGRNNALPWHIPEDMQFFKRVTMGKPMILGRRTWDSIGRALPGRTSIVVTRQRDWQAAAGVYVVNSLDEARTVAERIGELDGVDEATIIGGSHIFREAFAFVGRIYLTEVHAEVEGDVHFPAFDRNEWVETFRKDHEAPEGEAFGYSFVILDRRLQDDPHGIDLERHGGDSGAPAVPG